MKYVILNDGETYTDINGCVIFDSTTNKLYSIREDKEVTENMRWAKGIADILDDEINSENDGIMGK
jgi:hypothetical protein